MIGNFYNKYIKTLKSWKGIFSISMNAATIGQNVAGGLSNIWSTSIGFVGFLVMQANYSYENKNLRTKIAKLEDDIKEILTENKSITPKR